MTGCHSKNWKDYTVTLLAKWCSQVCALRLFEHFWVSLELLHILCKNSKNCSKFPISFRLNPKNTNILVLFWLESFIQQEVLLLPVKCVNSFNLNLSMSIIRKLLSPKIILLWSGLMFFQINFLGLVILTKVLQGAFLGCRRFFPGEEG